MKLITWNIQWGRGVDLKVDLARIVREARGFADFDVLCLQEVADNFPDLGGNDDRDQFAELAKLLPGYQIVEEICYKQVERSVCKVVPDVKKVSKWVYSCKEDPFCIKKSGKHCTCDSCSDPQHRIQLVKREVIEEHATTKCVVEKIVETVPYKVYRKVPCGPAASSVAPTLETIPRPLPMSPDKK